MAQLTRPLARRDFLLDSGALTHFAADTRSLALWIAYITSTHSAPAVLVPYDIASEALTGEPRREAAVHRVLNGIAPVTAPEPIWLEASLPLASRAAWAQFAPALPARCRIASGSRVASSDTTIG